MCCDKFSIGCLWLFAIELRFVCWFQIAPMQIGFSENLIRFITTDNTVSNAGTAFDMLKKQIFTSIMIIQMNHLKACVD